MGAFEQELLDRLRRLADVNLRRHLRRVTSPQQPHVQIDGRRVLNFSSNDYLGLATHPTLKEAAARAVRDFGTGSGASRLICGSLQPHEDLEERLADFKGAEAALIFSSGYATALGAITAVVSSGDIIVLDKLVHASIVDAARLSSAKLRIYAHNDLNDLEEILSWCARQRDAKPAARILIVTESLFSMDGDIAPLPQIVALKERFGAWLMVDEAHATGLFGANRRGLAEQFGVSDRIEMQMGTLGKALGASGGYIAGSRVLKDYLLNKARSFIFSTAPPPAVSASASAAIEVVRSVEGGKLVEKLRGNIDRFCVGANARMSAADSPIVPYAIGNEAAALKTAADLLEQGIFVPAIRYPTVGKGEARLRFTFSAAHEPEDLQHLNRAVAALQRQT